MASDPRERLAELLREAGRRRDAIREFGLAGYVTMVDQHRKKLHELHDRIRRLCEEQGLELPPEVTGPPNGVVRGFVVLDRRRVLCEAQGASDASAERYVLSYEDQRGHRSTGYYTNNQEGARAELERRTSA